ncbi:hypothetical protein Droror1_Dr00019009 [Drosera rotundifolia]
MKSKTEITEGLVVSPLILHHFQSKKNKSHSHVATIFHHDPSRFEVKTDPIPYVEDCYKMTTHLSTWTTQFRVCDPKGLVTLRSDSSAPTPLEVKGVIIDDVRVPDSHEPSSTSRLLPSSCGESTAAPFPSAELLGSLPLFLVYLSSRRGIPPVLIGGVEEQRLSPVAGEERNSCSRLGTTVARRSTASGETASSSSRSDAPDPRWLGAGCEEEASSGGDWVVDGLEAAAG